MRLTIPQDRFADALGTVSRAVSPKNTIPALAGVHVRATPGRLLLRATDLELAIERTVEAEVHEPGEAILPARYLADLVRKIPFGDVDLEVKDGQPVATVRWGKSHYTIHGFPAADFPDIPAVSGPSFRVDRGAFRELIRQTAFAAAQEEARPYLKGVFLTLAGSELLGVATDSIRIATTRVPADNPENQSLQVIVPGRSLQELARLLAGAEEEEPLRVSAQPNQVSFDLGAIRVISRLLEGQYPDVLRLIPTSYPTRARLDRSQFLEAIDRAQVLSRDGSLRFSVGPEQLVITGATPEVGQVYEEVPLVLEGDPLDIGFNARYLTEGLRAMDDREFWFEFSGSRNPARIRPAEGEGYVYVVLPLVTF